LPAHGIEDVPSYGDAKFYLQPRYYHAPHIGLVLQVPTLTLRRRFSLGNTSERLGLVHKELRLHLRNDRLCVEWDVKPY